MAEHTSTTYGNLIRIDPEGGAAAKVLDRMPLRFWIAVLHDYSFSDVDVEFPAPRNETSIWMKTSSSGHGGYGLSLVARILRNPSPAICCYLSWRKGVEDARSIFAEIETSLEELRGELGDDLDRVPA